MNEDLVVRTTVDFIRSSPKYLDLALQIEEAMPRLKAGLTEEFLKSVESTITTDEWRLHRWDAGLTKKELPAGIAQSGLAFRRRSGGSDGDPVRNRRGALGACLCRHLPFQNDTAKDQSKRTADLAKFGTSMGEAASARKGLANEKV